MEPVTTTTHEAKPRQRPTRSRLLKGMGILCVLFLAAIVIHQNSRPRYQGKTAEEWFGEVTTSTSGTEFLDQDPAVIGLRHLGTNAVWFLWHETTRKETPVLSSLQKRLDRLTGRHQNNPPSADRAQTAWVILFVFGPETEVLVPEALERLKSSDPNEAAHAAMLLGRTKQQPEVVVPVILKSLALTNRNGDHRVSHYVGLKEFGPQAKDAVPVLRAQLAKPKIPNSYEGYWLAKAILTINGPGPEVTYFTTNLVPGNFKLSYPNLAALESLGTNARPATVELHKFMLTLTNAEDTARVQAIIKNIDPEGIYQKP